MRNIWVISDTHLQHANIIKYCMRPFWKRTDVGGTEPDPEAMDEKIIENWNSVVKDEDIIYHLGDVYFGKSERADWLLSRLKGRKRLLLGNHDDGKDEVLHKHFQKIELWRMWPEFGLIFSHVPLHKNALNPNKCPVNVHGHIHNNVNLNDKAYINVSVELINYTPVNIEDLRVFKDGKK